MPNQIDIERYIDLDKFIENVEKNANREAVELGVAFATRFVQTDDGDLRKSIKGDIPQGEIYSDLPYAAEQEYGPAASGRNIKFDPNRVVGFGFTPYLRPAAGAVAEAINKNIGNVTKRIIDASIRVARI
jgi:hypothetical protein